MLYLVVTVCLAGSPVASEPTKDHNCRQEAIKFEGEQTKPTTWQCFHYGQTEMAKWWGDYQEQNDWGAKSADEKPKYEIREYHCAEHMPHENGRGVL